MTITEFFTSILTPQQIAEIAEYCGNKTDSKIHPSEAIQLVESCKMDYFRKKFPFMPKIVDHNKAHDTDHDHGAWTERYIIEHEAFSDHTVYYAVDIDKFGQGDTENEDIEMIEVKPRTITKVIYE